MTGAPPPLLVYYSRTGTTAAVARAVEERLPEPEVERVRPTKRRRYPNWLARSFVPGSTVPIEPVDHDPRDREAVFLGTPKWTLSCPPVNAYLDRVRFEGAAVGLFLTFGGFDEERYARRLDERLREAGADAVETLLLKRDRVEAGPGAYEDDVSAFVEDVLASADGG
ncbi:MAG: flavodoxin family protein [Halobacteriales archaeon]